MPAIPIRAYAFVIMSIPYDQTRALLRRPQALVGGDAVRGSGRRQVVDHRRDLQSADGSADRLIGLDGVGLVLVVGGHGEESLAQYLGALCRHAGGTEER